MTTGNMARERMQRLRALQTPDRSETSRMVASVRRGYYPLPRDVRLRTELTELLDGCLMAQAEAEDRNVPATGRLGEGRAVAVLGSSGTGKTRTIHRILRSMPEFDGYMAADGGSMLLSVVAPSPCTLKLLGRTLLEGLGYAAVRDLKENVTWALVRHQLRIRGVRFILVDELQHLFQSRGSGEVQKVLDTLKSLMQTPDWPVWLIISGLPAVADIIETDVQIRRRCTFVRFVPLCLANDCKEIADILSQYAGRAKVRPGHAPSDDFLLRLLHASHGAAGLLIEIVQDAVVTAAREGASEVATAHFAAVYERRTGCSRDGNVFLVDDWEVLDPYRARGDGITPADDGGRKPRDERSV